MKSKLTLDDHKAVAMHLKVINHEVSAIMRVVSGRGSRVRLLDQLMKADRILCGKFRSDMEDEMFKAGISKDLNIYYGKQPPCAAGTDSE